jgi:hypothetical protein
MMFRRRPINTKLGGPGGRARILLTRAHRMLENGAYLPAGHLFEELAEGALRRRIPRAPFLFLQAGRGYLFGGESEKGVNLLMRGLGFLKDASRWGELHRVGNRAVEELVNRGYEQESQQIAEWIASVLPENIDQMATRQANNNQQRPALPTHCPQCGGAVDPKTISWMDADTAECLYCGSPIRAEPR